MAESPEAKKTVSKARFEASLLDADGKLIWSGSWAETAITSNCVDSTTTIRFPQRRGGGES